MTAENAFRSAYWDNIKGFLIILVVFAHCLLNLQNSPLNNALVDAIYMFHMPAFVFVSGYFSKSEHSRSFFPIMNLFVAFILLNGFFLIREIFALGGGNIINRHSVSFGVVFARFNCLAIINPANRTY